MYHIFAYDVNNCHTTLKSMSSKMLRTIYIISLYTQKWCPLSLSFSFVYNGYELNILRCEAFWMSPLIIKILSLTILNILFFRFYFLRLLSYELNVKFLLIFGGHTLIYLYQILLLNFQCNQLRLLWQLSPFINVDVFCLCYKYMLIDSNNWVHTMPMRISNSVVLLWLKQWSFKFCIDHLGLQFDYLMFVDSKNLRFREMKWIIVGFFSFVRKNWVLLPQNCLHFQIELFDLCHQSEDFDKSKMIFMWMFIML